MKNTTFAQNKQPSKEENKVCLNTKKMPYNKKLVEILKLNDGNNKFIIIPEQSIRFEETISKSYHFKCFSNWFKFLSQKGEKDVPLLFSHFKIGHKQILNDQTLRAEYIYDLMIKDKNYELITMDGHGRLIYSLISFFQQNKSFVRSKRKIHLIDIDENTNNFHKLMFPSSIFKRNVNIPEPQDILKVESFVKNVKIKKPLLYLNFCGIACCGDEKDDGKTKVFNFIRSWLNNNNIIIISLSLRKTKLKLEVNGKKTFYGMIQEFNIKQISRRSNFYTFEISKKEI
tara:strand:+ start:3305 stop:4162 length:858 start_codon:yes stop_codon:yes gene_type:complete